ncbi:hypothetical protein [Sporosarcina beigongshangi]|uniref:hypothetical protein n=1 Tax=Sporosarcina beigongshangi TaxID=2782538 RepID=UPI00193A0523|nr:hypothetical protein [Sporosarcina beigongshangi]
MRNERIRRSHKKHFLVLIFVVLSAGFLFGCNGVDEDEPDPTEVSSEKRVEIRLKVQ